MQEYMSFQPFEEETRREFRVDSVTDNSVAMSFWNPFRDPFPRITPSAYSPSKDRFPFKHEYTKQELTSCNAYSGSPITFSF